MHESEILIIGGGIAGVSTAYHLTLLGHGVTLLERGEIAGAASGVNAGSIGAMGWGAIPDLQALLTMGSRELFRSMQLDHGFEIELRCSGALQAIQTASQFDFIRDRTAQLRAQGFHVELLSTREARGLEPALNPALPGVLHLPLWAQAHPVKATQAFARAAASGGAELRTRADVTEIRDQPGGSYEVRTARETYVAGALVLAAGAWTRPVGALLGLNLPIIPVRGQMWATPPLPPCLFHTLLSAESTLHWANEPGADATAPPELTHRGAQRVTRHLYGRQNRDGEILFGGDRQLTGYDTTPDPTGIAENREQAAEVLPMLRDLPTSRRWAGLMPFSLDGLPLIGPIPDHPHLYIVSGLASSGFGRGPMAGKLLADLIHTGHPHPALAEADPARF